MLKVKHEDIEVGNTQHTRRLPDHPAFQRPRGHGTRSLVLWALCWVVLLLTAGLGVFLWQHNKAVRLEKDIASLRQQLFIANIEHEQNHSTDSTLRASSLVEGVVLELPPGWEKLVGATNCPPPRGNLICEKRQTLAFKDVSKNDFSADVTVYQNAQDTYAKAWFLNVYREAALSGEGDPVEERVINGRSAAYVLQGAGGSPQDVYYVLSGNKHSVVLHARVFTKGESSQDFRAYLPAVQSLASAIQFEDKP